MKPGKGAHCKVHFSAFDYFSVLADGDEFTGGGFVSLQSAYVQDLICAQLNSLPERHVRVLS